MSLALHDKTPAKVVEEIEERLIVALKETTGASLLDASSVHDIFLDLLNSTKELKEVMLNG